MRWQTPDLTADGHAVIEPDRDPIGSTPFRHLQESQGAVFGRRMNWQQPFHCGDVSAEHHAIHQRCGLIDSSSQSKLLIEGPDSLPFVQRIFTADLDVPVGRGVFSCACNPTGGAIDDMICWRLGKCRWFCIGSTAARRDIFRWIVPRARRWSLAATVLDQTDAYAYIAIQGPVARAAMSKLTATSISNEQFPHLSLHRVVSTHRSIGHVVGLSRDIHRAGIPLMMDRRLAERRGVLPDPAEQASEDERNPWSESSTRESFADVLQRTTEAIVELEGEPCGRVGQSTGTTILLVMPQSSGDVLARALLGRLPPVHRLDAPLDTTTSSTADVDADEAKQMVSTCHALGGRGRDDVYPPSRPAIRGTPWTKSQMAAGL